MALPNDVPAILDMVAALAAFNDDQSTLSKAFLQQHAFGPVPIFRILVAERAEGGLIGYAALLPAARLHFGQLGCDLHHLFADVAARGQGVGRALVMAAAAWAAQEGARYLKVATNAENLKAQGFYTAVGFQRRRTLPPMFEMALPQSGSL
ncbi:GNAT family N-acetyltransferase [Cognatishimia sp. SS12]|nr:GNAT family N-acetyltransferase [Cognatishimia sp. SS12]